MKVNFFKIIPILFVIIAKDAIAQDIATNQNEITAYDEDELHDDIISKRMQSIQKTIPLFYNDQVKVYLDKYISKNYKPYMEKLLALSQFYFPIYETIFKEAGVPDEIKYLSVVESSLDPNCVSRSGAVGPWQFMYATAKIYDLSMNSFIDERKDVFATSYAMSKYLLEAHDEFNDWLLALASYNCGRGCVRRAIIRSGLNQPTFWQLAPFLPQETRNYIPKFIAMTYVLNHREEYNLDQITTEMNKEYKVLMIDKHINLQHIAQAINQPLDLLKKFNPAYKKNVVNGTAESPKRLLLPHEEEINDSLLYVALNNPLAIPNNYSESIENAGRYENKTHIVHKGETLTAIGERYDVSVKELRIWNSLSTKSSITGRNLIVTKPNSRQLANKANTSTKRISYVVKNGDTLSGIAAKHKGATVTKIKADNKLGSSKLRIGQKLIIN